MALKSFTPQQRDVIALLGKEGVKELINSIRVDLHARILSLDDRGLIKLQGKLEFADELENIFLGLLK